VTSIRAQREGSSQFVGDEHRRKKVVRTLFAFVLGRAYINSDIRMMKPTNDLDLDTN
jgi:hypothetical protein